MPPEEFLRQLRQPLKQDAWGEFTGRIVHVVNDTTREGTLRVRVTFTPEELLAQIVLNDTNVYGLEQRHDSAGKTSQRLDLPPKENPPGLFDYGIAPSDLTFSFIYWTFVEELPEQSSRMRTCRVMRLKAPDGSGVVDVWFDATYGFPMEAKWYHAPSDKTPWRTLVMKGAKRHENGLWFVREMRLDGTNWKTRVTFDFVEKNAIGDGEKKN